MTKITKVIEKMDGLGKIVTSDGKQVKVRYFLAVLRTVDDDVSTGELTSYNAVRGAIEVSREEGKVYLMGRHFTLKTDDGRCLKAWAKKGDPESRHWEIVASGPRGLEPC